MSRLFWMSEEFSRTEIRRMCSSQRMGGLGIYPGLILML